MKMRICSPLLVLLLGAAFMTGQVDSCRDLKTGVFQFRALNGGVYTIIRTDSSQFERNSKQASHSKLKVRWESDCCYVLYDAVVYMRGKQPKRAEQPIEISNLVYKFEQPDKFHVKTFVPGLPDTVKTVFTKLDTGKYYNNLFQLKEFSEYKNSKTYGQTLFDEIYSIDYYQSNNKARRFLITFETTYHGEANNKTRLLDKIVINLKDKEKIANSNCRFNGEFDDEIVAVYTSPNGEQEASIARAFRCNRQSAKIEEIDAKKVQYKEADQHRIKW